MSVTGARPLALDTASAVRPRELVEHLPGQTFHGRKGEVRNAFRYSVDYVILDPEAVVRPPRGFARNSGALASLWDGDHGGPLGAGRGAAWVREVLAAHDLDFGGRLLLMAQPRMLGHVFNPVSFWLVYDRAEELRCVIAEVTNTYGDRHSYLAHRDDKGVIGPADELIATKLMYVSPFQPIEGGYTFRFDIRPEHVGIWIDYTQGKGGLIATLTGPRVPLTTRGLLGAMIRRPLGSRRVLGLIHWQALKLWWKGARFRRRPAPPEGEVSR
ncbi:MAG: DUF1365 domain-containing protein [Shimia sp.]